MCKKQLGLRRAEASAKIEVGTKAKIVYTEGCTLIIDFFIVKHIPRLGRLDRHDQSKDIEVGCHSPIQDYEDRSKNFV